MKISGSRRTAESTSAGLKMEVPSTSKRVRIKDIAQRLGLGVSTVSMALQKNREIAEATRKLVQQTANEMGYRPDPELRRLMSHMRGARQHAFQSTVFFVCDARHRQKVLSFARVFDGLKNRLKTLGYSHDFVDYPRTQPLLKLFERTTKARCVEGLILLPSLEPLGLSGTINWDRYSTIALLSCNIPLVDTVKFNWYQSTRLSLQQLGRARYGRIGLIASYEIECLTDGAVSAAVLHSQIAGLGEAELRLYWLPSLDPADLHTGFFPAPPNLDEALHSWFLRERPDVLVITLEEYAVPVLAALRLTPTSSIPVFVIGRSSQSPFAGCTHDYDRLGTIAAEWLDTKIRTEQTGLNHRNAQMMLSGEWVDEPPIVTHLLAKKESADLNEPTGPIIKPAPQK